MKKINQIWNDMLEVLHEENEQIYSYIQSCLPMQISTEQIIIGTYDNIPTSKVLHAMSDEIGWCFSCIGYLTKRIVLKDISETLLEYPICESPIEEMFLKACQDKLTVTPQYEIGRYRVDFALPVQKVAIELDGHEYHKTKEQRTHDAERERYLQKQGWQVIRFTGSEVYRDIEKCIQDVIDIISI